MSNLRFVPELKSWQIEAPPHIVLRLKRVFAKISNHSHGVHNLSHTLENCRDLLWFTERYKFDVSPGDIKTLKAGAKEFDRRGDRQKEILSGDISMDVVDMAIPPRDYQKIAAMTWMNNKFLLLGDDLGVGKAQPITSNVMTPDGWRAIGALRIGDIISDPDGGIGEVTGVFPQGQLPVWCVKTSDKEIARCCSDHLWGLYNPNDRRRGGKIRIKKTSEISNDLHRSYHGNKNWKTSNWFLPIHKPLEFSRKDQLVVNPYLVGALIGDGGLTGMSVNISKPDVEFISKIGTLIPKECEMVFSDNCTWRISRSTSTGLNVLKSSLNVLGMMGKLSVQKSIPNEYLTASVSDRVELLSGLMDTDGDCSNKGVCTYNTSSEKLKDDVIDLVRSLGGISNSYGFKAAPKYKYKGEIRIGKPAWRVCVRLPFNPFTLSRKAVLWKKSIMARPIKSIYNSGLVEEMVCISVSTKRNLYITDGNIVTHNTGSAICGLVNPEMRPALVSTLTHLCRQWGDEFKKFAPKITTHILQKATPYKLPKINGKRPDVIICNYHKLSGWADELCGKVKSVVYDECQELRRGDSAKYSAAKHISSGAEYRIGLSATPIYNFGSEMVNVVGCLSDDALGDHAEFSREWCGGGDRIENPQAFGSYLRESGIMLRRTRHDVGREIPPVQKIVHTIDSDPKELEKVSGSAAELARLILADSAQRGDKFTASGQFDMIVRQATGIAKAPYVADFVRLLVESGESVLLYAWHRSVYDILKTKLRDLFPVFYTGHESESQKALSKQLFVEGKSKILVMSLRAGAGVDGLQHVCRTVVVGELDWSPGVLEQCVGRVARDGQPDPVTAYMLVAEDGADPVMADVLGLKAQQLSGIKNPEADLIERIISTGDHVKKLAASYLERTRDQLELEPF